MGVDLTKLKRKTTGLGARIRWHANNFLTGNLWLLNLAGARFTVFDAFGAPGDTLLAAIVCRHVKQSYPRIRLNLLTPNPELVESDPNIDEINKPEGYVCLWHWYLDHILHRDAATNILEPAFKKLGIRDHEYRARVFLSDGELNQGASLVKKTSLPILAFNTLSKEPVKNWPLESWLALLEKLRGKFELVQLGDSREPVIPGVQRFAGSLGMRESMAVLAGAHLYMGPDSFLMHAANGLGVPSVIIFGGSRTPENLGYRENTNLFVKMACGPCWIHENQGGRCEHHMECMALITPEAVLAAVENLFEKTK